MSVCTKTQRKLCGEEACQTCFTRSFKSVKNKTKSGKLKVDCYSHKDNNNIKPINICKYSSQKFNFICEICNHSFEKSINSITKHDSWCFFCVNQKLCINDNCNICFLKSFASFKNKTANNKLKLDCFDNNKNKIKPRQLFMNIRNRIWFTCDICNLSFRTRIDGVTKSGVWCSFCKNKTEQIFLTWLKNNYKYEIKQQIKYNWCISPDSNRNLTYDFAIEELKLIIEVDGLQHFKQVSNWYSPEYAFEHDRYKIKKAILNNYSIIRIFQEDIYKNENNWENNTKNVIKKYTKPIMICIGSEILYKKYNDININDNINIENKLFNCDKCNICFTFKCKYEQHLKLKHNINNDKINNIKENNLHKNNNQLNKQYLISTNDENGDKQYKCTKCNIEFSRKYSFTRHCKRSIHTTKNNFEKTKKIVNKLDSHMLKINKMEKDKPYKCDKCKISFKFNSQFQKHCKTELHITGKKKIRSDKKAEFKCTQCNLYTIKQQTNLKLHILNNHKTTEERKAEFPFYCELCDTGTLKETQFKKHLETKKHKKKFELSTKK